MPRNPEGPEVHAQRMDRLNQLAHRGRMTDIPPQPLSQLEQDIVYGISLGLTNRQIAQAMVLSLDSIKTRYSVIAGKLGSLTNGRAELVRLGFEQGYLHARSKPQQE